MLLLTLVLLFLPARAPSEEGAAWEIYTPNGVERRAYIPPTTVHVGLPEAVEVRSAVTGTGQGKRVTDVQVVVSEGIGGRPAPGVANDRVYNLCKDEEGDIWVATMGGLSRFNDQNWTTFTEEDGLGSQAVVDVVTDLQGHLWAIGTGGITQFDGQKWIHYQVVEGGRALAVAPNGDIWFGAFRLYRFDGQDWWEYGPADGIPSPNSRASRLCQTTSLLLSMDSSGFPTTFQRSASVT